MWIQIRLFLQEQPNLGRLRLSKKLPNISADDKSFNGDLSTCAVGGQWLSGKYNRYHQENLFFYITRISVLTNIDLDYYKIASKRRFS